MWTVPERLSNRQKSRRHAMADAKQIDDPLFIGWLRMPRRDARFLRPVVAISVLAMLAVAALIVWRQRSAGNGAWNDGATVVVRGVVVARPYAMLRTLDENGQTRTYLLVEDGKFGAGPRVAGLLQGVSESAIVEARGTILHRDDQWMLALEPGATGMRSIAGDDDAKRFSAIASVLPRPIGERVMLQGEIIDPKCYFGAMKPGGGKTHKACAMRCVAGGIPPMLVTNDTDGRPKYFLLATPEGGPANESLFPYVGDQVELTGTLEQHGDIVVVKVAPSDVRVR
jgi:hypothetical protein